MIKKKKYIQKAITALEEVAFYLTFNIYIVYQYITCDKLKETKKNIVINNFICNKL